MRSKVFLLAKVIASSLLVGYIIRSIDVYALYAAVSDADRSLLVLALLMHGIGFGVSAYRWQLLLNALGYHVPMTFLLNSVFVATFFNNLLPTTIGGDVVRAHDTARYTKSRLSVAFSVITTDRLTGLFALFVFAAIAFVAGLNVFGQDVGVRFVLAAMAGLFVVVGFLLNSRVARQLDRLLDLPLITRGAAKVRSFYEALLTYKQHKRILARVLLLSLVLQVNVIVHYYLVSLALHQGVSLLYFFLFVPILISVLQVAPSINGIGYREAGFVILLSKSGVDTASAVSLSLLTFGMTVALGALGGIVFALRRERIDLRGLTASQK